MAGTLVFDGDCGFCTASAGWLARRSRVTTQPWQLLDLRAVGLTEREVSEAAWYLAPDGARRSGARAIAAALREGGLPWRVVGFLLDLPPVRPLAAVGYRFVARHRHRLPGSTPACRLP